MRFLIYKILILFSVNTGYSQYFNHTYDVSGTNDPDNGMCVIRDTFGYILTGQARINLKNVMHIIKVDESGNLRQKFAFPIPNTGTSSGFTRSLRYCHDSTLIACGSIYFFTDSSNSWTDYYLMRLTRSLDTMWIKTYSDSLVGRVFQVCPTRDKGFVLVGEKEMPNYDIRFALLKVDSMGNLEWSKKYSNGRWCSPRSVDTTSDGGYIIGGMVNDFANRSVVLLKLDSAGHVEWETKMQNNTIAAVPGYVIRLRNGQYAFASSWAEAKTGNSIQSRLFLGKVDRDGAILWQRQYGVIRNYNSLTCITELENGDLVAGGSMFDLSGQSPAGVILRTDSNGNAKFLKQYRRYLDSQAKHYQYDVIQAADGGFVGCGNTFSPAEGFSQDFWLYKVDSLGCKDALCYNTDLYEEVFDPLQVHLYPNPCQNKVWLQLPESWPEKLQAEFYDLQGRCLQKVLCRTTQPLEISTENFPAGIIYYRILSESEFLYQGKMIKE